MKHLPLTGVRVLDFSWVMAGPVMTSMLADLGAEVIKVETRSRIDSLRRGRPVYGDTYKGDRGGAPEVQPFQHATHRNKYGITLNLATAEGLALAKRLAATCDIVAENFSAGTFERMGLGYGVLKELNPSIILISISAAGQTGPMREAVTFNPIAIGLSGLGSLLGYTDSPPVGVMRNFAGDTSASLYGAMAVLGALFRARRTGIGDHVDLSQWEAAAAGLDLQFIDASLGNTPKADGNHHPWMAPHGNYPCAGERPNWNWIAISCETDAQWREICDLLELDDLRADPELDNQLGRWRRRDRIDARIAEATRAWDKLELADLLQARGVPAAAVMDVGDQFGSAHFRERGIHVEAHHSEVGYELVQGLPWRTARAGRGEFRMPAPHLGRDNEHVYKNLLGLSEREISELEQKGALY